MGLAAPERKTAAAGSRWTRQRCGESGPARAARGILWQNSGKQAKAGGQARASKPPRCAKAPPEWAAFAQQYFPFLAGLPLLAAGELLLLPAAGLPPLPKGVRVLRCGVALGRVQKGRFEPAHHLFTAFGAGAKTRKSFCWRTAARPPGCGARRSGHKRPGPAGAACWWTASPGGRKGQRGRVKNHYPKALRNLG